MISFCRCFLLTIFICESFISTQNLNYVALRAELTESLDDVLDFINNFHYQMNLDVWLALTLVEVKIQKKCIYQQGGHFGNFCVFSNVQMTRKLKMQKIIAQFLMDAHQWVLNDVFLHNQLHNLGIYGSWTVVNVTKNKIARYNGVSSDDCLTELLSSLRTHSSCVVSSSCQEFMFGNRVDTGYILTHRLLYLHIMRMLRCPLEESFSEKLTRNYCSLILKEARTNEILGFPQHDLFLEQVILCGLEGYTEFLNANWTLTILSWKTKPGCYKNGNDDLNGRKINSRSANVISFGCTNHATGLGAATLALNLRYVLFKIFSTVRS
ncbi:hypothetical protein RI129_009887 [Pyrocoelia pectoralis]|uniref:Uncharacterized protein n=1 Tax=Pyrocoelia pectoralis TaxID=417401 RepID=A0AAN7V359_9COLE